MDRRVERILEVMNGRLPERVSGQTLSKSVNLSPSRLRQVFKKETSLSPKQYIKVLRMRMASNRAQFAYGEVMTISSGGLGNYTVTRDELLRRAHDVFGGLRDGWLKLRIDRTFPLAQAAEAHRLLESRQTAGKLILNC